MELLTYFAGLAVKLIPLLAAAVFLAEFSRRKLGEKKLKSILIGNHPWTGRLRAAALGAVLPFCECGAFPVMIGLLRAGVPYGYVLTFFIVSPIVSIPAFVILLGVFGPLTALLYLVTVLICGIVAGLIIERVGEKLKVFNPDMEREIMQGNKEPESVSHIGEEKLAAGGNVGSCAFESDNAEDGLKGENTGGSLKAALDATLSTMKKILPYAVAAMLIASIMHMYVPTQLIEGLMATKVPYDVLIAAAAGIPIYTGDCTMIAAAAPIITATGALGAGVAFIIAGSGTSINGLIFMSSVFSRRFILVYVLLVFFIAIVAGTVLKFAFA